MSANESRPAGAASELIAASKTSVSQPRPSATRFDSRRLRAHRAVVRELDEWFGIFKYPDPNLTYAIAPSREAALDE